MYPWTTVLLSESERIDLANAYVALSNAHKVEFIIPMFSEKGTYRSAHVGEFKGRAAIGYMMSDFFTRFPDVRWNVPAYRCIGKSTIEFDFEMTATEELTGSQIERRGIEEIEFSDDGLIFRLEVK